MIDCNRGALLDVCDLYCNAEDGRLCGIHFAIAPGRMMGVVGDDDSGRTLVTAHVLGYAIPQKGVIRFMSEPLRQGDERIAPLSERAIYPPNMTLLRLERFLRSLYTRFRSDRYFELLDRLALSPTAKVSRLDRGGRLKLQLAVALSVEAKLLVACDALDDADMPFREEIGEILLEFTADGGAVLISSAKLSHIEQLIDDITVLHGGKQLFSAACDELPREFALLRCPSTMRTELDGLALVGLTEGEGCCEALVHRVDLEGRAGLRGVTVDLPTTEDILRLGLAHERSLGAREDRPSTLTKGGISP